MNYRHAIDELEALGVMPTQMPQLEPMRRALLRSGLLARINAKRNVVIAGTNGKGSTSATLSRLLHSAGSRVGLYTSPHLITTRERIRLAEEDISEDDFVASYLVMKEIIHEEKLTHFEALTLIAAHLFFSGMRLPAVDWAIWEVGLGGMFDATNAIPHHYCAITPLALDHQAVLGHTLEEIARQKFGIIGKDSVVTHSPLDPSLSSLQKKISDQTGCEWIAAKPVRALTLNQIATSWGNAELSLWGARAAENTALALTLFEAMGFDPKNHLNALSQVRWPGRFSRALLPGFACPVYLSGDHNPGGVESLLEILAQLKWERLHVLVGIGRDKHGEAMLERLTSLPRHQLYLTETPFKGLQLAEYPDRFVKSAVCCDPSIFQILSQLKKDAGAQDLVLVTGSLYLVGQVLANPHLIA